MTKTAKSGTDNDLKALAKRILKRVGLYTGGRGSGTFWYRDKKITEELARTELGRSFWDNCGLPMDKWHHYFAVYERHFGPYRGRPVRFLEIGVQNGGSMRMWRDFFGPEAVIFGIDIDPKCARLNGKHGQVRIGSQADRLFLAEVVSEMGGLDLVIDDGSHVMEHIRASLDELYPRLSEGGCYMVEDLHTSYWPDWGGGRRSRNNFFRVVAQMVEDLHSPYHGAEVANVSATSGYLRGIHVYDSIVVLDKEKTGPPQRSVRGGSPAAAED